MKSALSWGPPEFYRCAPISTPTSQAKSIGQECAGSFTVELAEHKPEDSRSSQTKELKRTHATFRLSRLHEKNLKIFREGVYIQTQAHATRRRADCSGSSGESDWRHSSEMSLVPLTAHRFFLETSTGSAP
ncbi:hypothetical protein CSKR_106151 [Clonorchis sinensis]|uniref:Uncharacterized protein n=1 Tax=Clonorchis sinensis TaxID=79923 RepID=A0A419PJR8_CLOSI|nr:hypothetical protein CSKR_106151 [Clonorchis sinensis]